MDALTGKSQRRQAHLAEAAQAEQRKKLAQEEASVAKVEAGQKAVTNAGGRGLLAFVDEKLKKTFGGGA